MYATDIALGCRARGIDVASVHERLELEGEHDDAVVLRAPTREQRVLMSNNAEHLVPIVDELGLASEDHFGVLFAASPVPARASAS